MSGWTENGKRWTELLVMSDEIWDCGEVKGRSEASAHIAKVSRWVSRRVSEAEPKSNPSRTRSESWVMRWEMRTVQIESRIFIWKALLRDSLKTPA